MYEGVYQAWPSPPPPPHFLGVGPFFFVKMQIIMIALGGARKFVQKPARD